MLAIVFIFNLRAQARIKNRKKLKYLLYKLDARLQGNSFEKAKSSLVLLSVCFRQYQAIALSQTMESWWSGAFKKLIEWNCLENYN